MPGQVNLTAIRVPPRFHSLTRAPPGSQRRMTGFPLRMVSQNEQGRQDLYLAHASKEDRGDADTIERLHHGR